MQFLKSEIENDNLLSSKYSGQTCCKIVQAEWE